MVALNTLCINIFILWFFDGLHGFDVGDVFEVEGMMLVIDGFFWLFSADVDVGDVLSEYSPFGSLDLALHLMR